MSTDNTGNPYKRNLFSESDFPTLQSSITDRISNKLNGKNKNEPSHYITAGNNTKFAISEHDTKSQQLRLPQQLRFSQQSEQLMRLPEQIIYADNKQYSIMENFTELKEINVRLFYVFIEVSKKWNMLRSEMYKNMMMDIYKELLIKNNITQHNLHWHWCAPNIIEQNLINLLFLHEIVMNEFLFEIPDYFINSTKLYKLFDIKDNIYGNKHTINTYYIKETGSGGLMLYFETGSYFQIADMLNKIKLITGSIIIRISINFVYTNEPNKIRNEWKSFSSL